MRRVGIMGGTFNPIHNGHVLMALEAKRQYNLDEVFIMPSKKPPHKENSDIASEFHRINMINLSIKDYTSLSLSTFELQREGTTYTADTLQLLKNENKDTEYYFIIGGDSLSTIHKWYKPEIIFSLCTILYTPRNIENPNLIITNLKEKYNVNILLIEMPVLEISSKDIRNRIKNQFSFEPFCHVNVCRYIMQYGLYMEKSSCEDIYKKIELYLQARLSRKRFIHTKGVESVSTCLAMCYEYDIKKARIAALLHDCAKMLSDHDLLAEAMRKKMSVTESQKNLPYLLHGKIGASYAKEYFGINDEEILNAIENHTTGRPQMSLLEKIIFLSDYIEPSRQLIGSLYLIDDIRKIAFLDIDQAISMALENSMNYLEQNNKQIDPLSKSTYKSLKER